LDRETRRRGDQPWWLTSGTSTSASVYGSDRVDRVKTADVQVERGSEGLGGRPVKDGGDTCRVAGTRMEYVTRGQLGGLSIKTIGGRFHGFRPQNPGGGSEKERTARGGIKEFASRRNYLMKGAVAVG
jgi:hypothetical protein